MWVGESVGVCVCVRERLTVEQVGLRYHHLGFVYFACNHNSNFPCLQMTNVRKKCSTVIYNSVYMEKEFTFLQG